MAAPEIALLIQALGPIVVPMVSGLITQLFKIVAGMISPAAMQKISPFLPIVSGVTGAVLSGISGGSVATGALGGLAATGAHQVVNQLSNASVKTS